MVTLYAYELNIYKIFLTWYSFSSRKNSCSTYGTQYQYRLQSKLRIHPHVNINLECCCLLAPPIQYITLVRQLGTGSFIKIYGIQFLKTEHTLCIFINFLRTQLILQYIPFTNVYLHTPLLHTLKASLYQRTSEHKLYN